VDRKLVDRSLRSEFADSLEIDENLRRGREQENRWDYLLGHEPSAVLVGLEPHSATTGEVSTVIGKRSAALEQLRGHLKSGRTVTSWFWVASGKVDFVPHEKAVTRLAQNGITFVGSKLTGKHLPKAPR
jgi:hypothetical protein